MLCNIITDRRESKSSSLHSENASNSLFALTSLAFVLLIKSMKRQQKRQNEYLEEIIV